VLYTSTSVEKYRKVDDCYGLIVFLLFINYNCSSRSKTHQIKLLESEMVAIAVIGFIIQLTCVGVLSVELINLNKCADLAISRQATIHLHVPAHLVYTRENFTFG